MNETRIFLRRTEISKGTTQGTVQLEIKGIEYAAPIGWVNDSPTNNCQMCSYGSFGTLLTYLKANCINQKEVETIIEEILGSVRKKIMLVDLHENYFQSIANFIKGSKKFKLILSSPYTNTNGSKMCIYLITKK